MHESTIFSSLIARVVVLVNLFDSYTFSMFLAFFVGASYIDMSLTGTYSVSLDTVLF